MGGPVTQDITHKPAAPRLEAMPANRTTAPGRTQAMKAHSTWNAASAAKNTPDGNQSRQCIGVTATWIAPAPRDAIAAQRAASRLSVFFKSFNATRTTVAEQSK